MRPQLLRSPWHEARLLAVLLLADAYARGTRAGARGHLPRCTWRTRAYVNNWDLVDSSAPHIVGAHLEDGDRGVLEELARSESLWERRIAILATQHFIRRGDFGTTLRIAEMLVDDRHDLIHKAVGWMLREVGNRDRAAEEAFLRRHHRTMPRTMLRYAIEKFPARPAPVATCAARWAPESGTVPIPRFVVPRVPSPGEPAAGISGKPCLARGQRHQQVLT